MLLPGASFSRRSLGAYPRTRTTDNGALTTSLSHASVTFVLAGAPFKALFWP